MFGQLFKDNGIGRRALRLLRMPMYKRCASYNYHTSSTGDRPFSLEEFRLRLYRRSSDLHEFVGTFYERFQKQTGKPVVAYKLHGHQLSDEDFEAALTDCTDKVILLHRRNLLAAAVSWCVALHTTQWVSASDGRVQSLKGLSIDVDAACWFIERTRQQTDQWRSLLKRNRVDYREFVYEDVFSDRTLASVWDFLDVERLTDAQPKTRQLMSRDRYREIVNIDEVNNALASDENGCLWVA